MFRTGKFFLLVFIATSSAFPVQLSISQEKQFFPHETSAYTQHVNVQIKTGAHPGTESKLPCQLFIVLDSSGSMAGADKWGNAVSAIEHIIRSMNHGDKIHLVQYNSVSSIVFENSEDQKEMLKALHRVYPSGGTNLMAGFDTMIPLLKKYSDRSTINRLFVLSDGQINEGVTEHNLLLETVTDMKKTYGITICSFGIGYDFDESLMTNIADHGSGDYFFIKGAESMEKIVGIAYRGSQNLMGTDAFLKLVTKYRTKVVDVYGYDLKEDDEQIVPIGNLRYNDAMNILLETKVDITEDLLTKDAIEYMTIELWMHDLTDHELKLVSTETVQFSFSDDEEKLKQTNEVVTQLVELEKIQRKQEEVAELLKQKRVEEARDLHILSSIDMRGGFIRFTSANTYNDIDVETKKFTEGKTETLLRRNADIMNSFDLHSDEPEKLAMEYGSSQRLNKKYSKAYDDL